MAKQPNADIQNPRSAWELVTSLSAQFVALSREVRRENPTYGEALVASHKLVLAAELKRIETELGDKYPLHRTLIGQLRIVVEALTVDHDMPHRLLGHVRSFQDAAFQGVSA